MKVLSSSREMKQFSHETGERGETLILVPTMGSLHEGHLALIREGKKRGNRLTVSIFVNPTQFNLKEDFEKYPRNFEEDLKKCEAEGVAIVFAPSNEEMYPPGEKEKIIPLPEVAKRLEGISRPGHFEGVIAIVSKLFRTVQPKSAIFGLKDFQQLRVIQEMAKQQKIPVEIIPHPIVRSPEGLALSSRNSRLSPEGIKTAHLLSQSLKEGEKLFQKGERRGEAIRNLVCEKMKDKIKIDYVVVVDAITLEGIEIIERDALVAIAAFVDGIRLIDNCLLDVKNASSL